MPRAKKNASVDAYLETLKEVTGEKKMPPRKLIKPIHMVEADKVKPKKKVAKKPTKKTPTAKTRRKKTSVNQILIDSPSILAVSPVLPPEINEPLITYNPDRPALEPVFVTQVSDLSQAEPSNLPSAAYTLLKADAPALPEVVADIKRFRDATNGIDLEWSDIDPDAPKPTLWTRTKRFFKEFFGG